MISCHSLNMDAGRRVKFDKLEKVFDLIRRAGLFEDHFCYLNLDSGAEESDVLEKDGAKFQRMNLASPFPTSPVESKEIEIRSSLPLLEQWLSQGNTSSKV